LQYFIGIDLAWGDKNSSGFSVVTKKSKKLKIVESKLLYSIDDILIEIQKYCDEEVFIGIDAPLVIPNKTGNREIEKEFNRDFSKYKISMLPVNKTLLSKYSKNIRSVELFERLSQMGFKRDFMTSKVVFEVYPHSTIATLFNNNQILPYKRKKGRDILFIKEQMSIYQNYLKKEFLSSKILQRDIFTLKGKSLKEYEDILDSLTCALSVYHSKYFGAKIYKLEGIDTFITPLSKWRVYIVKCKDETLYTGVTTDIERRVFEHNSSDLGAKYTKNRRPVELVYEETIDGKILAMKREYAIKQMSRSQKFHLIENKSKRL
jgi:putative endonuclease